MSSISHSKSLARVSSIDGEHARQAQASRAEATVDAQLVRQFKAGDDDAFREIVQRHQRRIFNIVLGCLHNRADAEEIVDDTFIRAHRGLVHFRGESSLATWLHHIAVNLARNRYWYLFRRRHVWASLDAPVSENSNVTLADFVPSEDFDPSQHLDQGEFCAIIATCLDRLPSRHRDILGLRSLLDRSHADIANSLGIKVGTVKSRIARARKSLRAKVDAMCSEFSSHSASSG